MHVALQNGILIFLIITEQAHIAEMVKTGQNVPDENTSRVKHLIDIFSVVLAQVDPIEMRPYLQCLSNEEQQQIQACTTASGNERGAIKMFSLLVLKGTSEMFVQLVMALKKTRHEQVATVLEDLQKSDCDCDDSGIVLFVLFTA